MSRLALWSLAPLLWACAASEDASTDASETDTTDAEPQQAPAWVDAYAGEWSGEWSDNTWGLSGGASLDIVVGTDSAMTVKLDLEGDIFEQGDPDAEPFAGTWTDDSFAFSGETALFGELELSFTSDGEASGTGTPRGRRPVRVRRQPRLRAGRPRVDAPRGDGRDARRGHHRLRPRHALRQGAGRPQRPARPRGGTGSRAVCSRGANERRLGARAPSPRPLGSALGRGAHGDDLGGA